jgi:hypothetical protein
MSSASRSCACLAATWRRLSHGQTHEDDGLGCNERGGCRGVCAVLCA